jgi:hypothetical protein
MKQPHTPATPESVWKILNRMAKASARYKKEKAELDIQLAKQKAELDEKIAGEMAEIARNKAELDEKLAKQKAEIDERMEKIAQERAETDKIMAKANADIARMQKTIGGIQNSNGSFAEEYFYNSFESGNKNFFGETFDIIRRNAKPLKPVYDDEYDIVMLNGKAVAIVEVKYKAQLDDFPQVIKKAETFRINYPDFQNYKIYLGLASSIYTDRIEQECISKGIAIIKQAGDTVIINDKHLKTF